MILIDANLLIYAATRCPQQAAAKAWLDEQLNGPNRVGIPWSSLLGFLRIVTNPRIYRNGASGMEDAWAQVAAWLACENVWVPEPSARHQQFLRETLQQIPEGGEIVSDAHLAALAMEHGLTLCSADRDFARFSGLRWMNPIQQ